MAKTDIQNWLRYWAAGNMVAVDKIRAFDQVFLARTYCQCMRVGVFTDVSDLAIWNALTDMRRAEAA